jgi:hypothetical protein
MHHAIKTLTRSDHCDLAMLINHAGFLRYDSPKYAAFSPKSAMK